LIITSGLCHGSAGCAVDSGQRTREL
jgi:hypothetical protein